MFRTVLKYAALTGLVVLAFLGLVIVVNALVGP